ncbi:endonuclease/exonuclease/phosphatase family protein [Bacillus sp. DNRA2]|uniref:endonuclease/exonuclease/phosphatase family protein n=1 Tax=Bacillus sp. DNRA2 TaxID=2723053 RepID=UPI00145FB4AA|nr:endonuclease/exonuclease/phosphatase family protein [Bacillus sp. DNRA2]NMD72837.1 endonuclease/exonuclease/phosphatase family protein [Bacillus sp. DNRA2]
MEQLTILEWNINLRTKKCNRDSKNFNMKPVDAKDLVIPNFVSCVLNEKNVDIIILTEFLKCDNWKEFISNLAQYNVFVNCDENDKGILIAVKKDIGVTKVINNIPINDKGKAPHFLQVNLKYKDKELMIIGTRICVGNGKKEDFESRANQFMLLKTHLSSLGKNNIVVIGDFNNAYIRDDYKGYLQEPYNYDVIKDGFKDINLDIHTPENGFSHMGYLKEDHIIGSENIEITCSYKDDFIDEKILGQDIFYNIYYQGHYYEKINDSNKKGIKIPSGYPDHNILFAEMKL